jgi:hypothetical protein
MGRAKAVSGTTANTLERLGMVHKWCIAIVGADDSSQSSDTPIEHVE